MESGDTIILNMKNMFLMQNKRRCLEEFTNQKEYSEKNRKEGPDMLTEQTMYLYISISIFNHQKLLLENKIIPLFFF